MLNLILLLIIRSAYAIPIATTSISGLYFGIRALGDPAKVIPAGTSDNLENASFNVTGDPNRAFTIVLPTSADVITGTGGNRKKLTVTSFTSFPSGNGTLSSVGDRVVYVGATIPAIPTNLTVGSYSGSFTFTVLY